MSLIALGAVVFDEDSFAGDKIRNNTAVTYKIRLRAEQYAGPHETVMESSRWQTSNMFPVMASLGPRGNKYGSGKPGWKLHISALLILLVVVRVRTIPRKAPNIQYPIILASSDTNSQYQYRH